MSGSQYCCSLYMVITNLLGRSNVFMLWISVLVLMPSTEIITGTILTRDLVYCSQHCLLLLDNSSKGWHQEIQELLLVDIYNMKEVPLGVCALEQVEYALFLLLVYVLISVHCWQALNICLLDVQCSHLENYIFYLNFLNYIFLIISGLITLSWIGTLSWDKDFTSQFSARDLLTSEFRKAVDIYHATLSVSHFQHSLPQRLQAFHISLLVINLSQLLLQFKKILNTTFLIPT